MSVLRLKAPNREKTGLNCIKQEKNRHNIKYQVRDSTLSDFVCLLTVISFWRGLGEGLKEAWRAAIHGVAKSRTLLSD